MEIRLDAHFGILINMFNVKALYFSVTQMVKAVNMWYLLTIIMFEGVDNEVKMSRFVPTLLLL